ncbi:hypothetical protein DL768_007738 [Monosporascus sp. mg162]|nr:hypothetical protein DL768_007738 [Monosporascus sp. mg162]
MPTRSGRVWQMDEIGLGEFNLLSLEELPNVRIISSKSLPSDTPYLTLSHRWGNPPSILLTKKTSFLLNDDISPHLLNCSEAAVFRHVIHVTRSLGFRYIWIDALCIMQDDGPEKTADIMQMDEIYSNSALNISATEGQIREGLVFDRKSLCRPSTQLNKGVRISSASSMQQVKSRWYQVVEEYSHTSLTFVDDRLLAISAVAKLFCSAMRLDPSEYLAGMWKDDLPLSMLWSQYPHPDMSGPDSTTSIATGMKHAPSWSWASVLGSISSVEMSSLVATTELLDVQIARVSPNFFDGAESCRLRLRGPVCKFRRRFRDGAPCIYVVKHTEFQEFNDFNFQKGRAIIIDWDTSRPMVVDWLKSHGSGPVSSTCLLLIASERSVDGPMERGVVLRRTAVRGTYARIGAFFIPFTSEYPGSELEDAFNGRLDTLSTDDYLDLDSSGNYTIDVV